jgi:hypothetical protein
MSTTNPWKRFLSLAVLLLPSFAPAAGCSSVSPVDSENVAESRQNVLGNGSCEGGLPDLGATVCCSSSCGRCEEANCQSRPGGASACCPSAIHAAAVACAHNAAPCAIDPDPLCLNGVADRTGQVCCPDFCGTCGGTGCSGRLGGQGLCCVGGITGNEEPTCRGSAAPCVMDADPLCEHGIERRSAGVCCAEQCGACAVSGCSGLPGGAANCCSSQILPSGRLCSEHDAPCILDGDPLCERGILSADGTVCCAASCGRCGGSDCSSLPGGLNACCTTHIEPLSRSCLNHEAPCVMDVPAPRAFRHPGLLNTQAEINLIRTRVGLATDPIRLGWDKLRSDSRASLSYVHQPYEILVVAGAASTPEEVQSKNDAQAAYAHALEWAVTGDQRHADKAKAIINDWARTLKRVESSTGASQVRLESAWLAPMFASAAEILRYAKGGSAGVSSGWLAADVAQAERMLRYLAFNARQTLYKDGNWGSSAALALISVGVFSGDRRMYEQGIQAWKALMPIVIDSQGVVNELRDRDCHHPQYTVLGLAQAAEIAWHQGDDLYGIRVGSESKARLLRAAEYMSNLFLGGTGVRVCTDEGLRGGYEIPYNHYRYRAGSSIAQRFTDYVLGIRPDGRPASFFLGWSTLTHAELSRP